MQPQNLRFGGGAAETLLHPLVAVAVAVAVLLMMCLPRRHVIVPLLVALFTIPLGQVVLVAGVHLTVPRILIMAGLLRCIVSGEIRSAGLLVGHRNSIDRIFTLWALVFFAIFTFQGMNAQSIIKGVGTLIDSLGGYILLRVLIRDRGDVRRGVKVLGWIAVIIGGCMLNEQLSGTNIFRNVGGLPPLAVRAGSIRSQGAFEVYITAGVFGATVIPLLVWLWSETKSKMAVLVAMIGGTTMAFTSHSSTPLLAYGAGILGLCFWPLRRSMRAVRWLLGLTLLGMHLVMKAPVWALVARMDVTGSSSGYHRYMLVDSFLRHFGDWWLLGTTNNGAWGWDMWDSSNQYVEYGLNGGLATLAAFLGLFYRGYAEIGTARKLMQNNRQEAWLLWCLGAALLAHLAAYFGIAYFDQMQFSWYTLLAMISATVGGAWRSAAAQAPEPQAKALAVSTGPAVNF